MMRRFILAPKPYVKSDRKCNFTHYPSVCPFVSPYNYIKRKKNNKKKVIDSITDANSRYLGGGLGWFRCGLRWFGGGLGLAWQVNVIKMFLNFFFNY